MARWDCMAWTGVVKMSDSGVRFAERISAMRAARSSLVAIDKNVLRFFWGCRLNLLIAFCRPVARACRDAAPM